MSTDMVTVLRTRGLAATKTIGPSANGAPDIVASYGSSKYYSVREETVEGLSDTIKVLDAIPWDSFIIRGQPLRDIDRSRCLRRLYADRETGEPATFEAVPRRWLLVDLDSIECPEGTDPCDGPKAARIARAELPLEFRDAACWWQLTSSAAIKPGLRLRLAFWLDKPAGTDLLDRWFAKSPVDASIFRAVQPIYVARPIVRGVADPVRGPRSGGLPGCASVVVPELPPPPPPIDLGTVAPRGQRYVSGDEPTVAEKRLEALCRGIERAGVGNRHRALMWAAAKSVELDDALSRSAIAARLFASARAAGLDDQQADLERQIRNGFKLGLFGTEAH